MSLRHEICRIRYVISVLENVVHNRCNDESGGDCRFGEYELLCDAKQAKTVTQ